MAAASAADGFIGLLGCAVLGLLVLPGIDRLSRPCGVLGACIWAWATPAATVRARAGRVVRILVVLLQWVISTESQRGPQRRCCVTKPCNH